MRFKNLTGLKFGKLTAVKATPLRDSGSVMWECKCDCGKIVIVRSAHLIGGYTMSCGCRQAEQARKLCKSRITHGLTYTPTGNTWQSMIGRCFNSTNPKWHIYGGKGVTVCTFLKESPHNLIAVIGIRPNDKTLDRIDSNRNYSCGTCPECVANGWKLNIRWATSLEQGRNSNRNKRIEIGGEIHCISEWAELSGVHPNTINARFSNGIRGMELLK